MIEKRAGPERREVRTVVLITPTRDRPEAFRLCERWVARQSRNEGVTWVVVDDGDRPVEPTMGQIYIRRAPSPHPCTIHQNVEAGLLAAANLAPDAVLFIEDDDWYSARYVEEMAREIGWARMAGEMHRRYYHLPSRGFLSCYNRKHAALAATAIRGDQIARAIRACHESLAEGRPFIDLKLWDVGIPLRPRHIRIEEIKSGDGAVLFACRTLSVGIKGAPGRGGLGQGHDVSTYQNFDRSGAVLRSWVGEHDADLILALGAARGQNAAE